MKTGGAWVYFISLILSIIVCILSFTAIFTVNVTDEAEEKIEILEQISKDSNYDTYSIQVGISTILKGIFSGRVGSMVLNLLNSDNPIESFQKLEKFEQDKIKLF